jgi:transposase
LLWRDSAAIKTMGKPYGDDLRRKFLAAYDQGDATLKEVADRFLVSLGWAKKVSAQRKRTKKAERVPHQPGRKPRVGKELHPQVQAWVQAQPDLTLAEVQAKVQREAGISLSVPQVWHLLDKLGLRLKKVAPRQRAGHRGQPQATRRVRRPPPHHLAGTVDFPR